MTNGYMVFDGEYQLNGDSVGGNSNWNSSQSLVAALESPNIAVPATAQGFYLTFQSQSENTWSDIEIDVIYNNGTEVFTILLAGILNKPRHWTNSGIYNIPLPPSSFNSTTMKIRFRLNMQGRSPQRGVNFFTVDEIAVTAAPQYDLVMDGVIFNPMNQANSFPLVFWQINDNSYYNYERWFTPHPEQVPISQHESASISEFVALIRNRGNSSITPRVSLFTGTSVNNLSIQRGINSPILAPNQLDTVRVSGVSANPIWTPAAAIGTYFIETRVDPFIQTDGFNDNNSTERNIWSRIRLEITDSMHSLNKLDSIDYISGYYGSGFSFIRPVKLTQKDTITSIRLYLRSYAGNEVFIVLGTPYDPSSYTPGVDNLIGYHQFLNDTTGYVNLNLLNTELDVGEHFISIISKNNTGLDERGVFFGSSSSDKVYSYDVANVGLDGSSGNNFYLSTFNPAYELNFGTSNCLENYIFVQETSCNSYTLLNGRTVTQSGIYFDTLYQNNNQCIDVIQREITILSNEYQVQQEACQNFNWWVNGNNYNTSGTYIDSVLNSFGCYDVYTLDLTITNPPQSINVTSCTPYTWSATGLTYAFSGSYQTTLTASNGCDSTVLLNLYVGNPAPYQQQVTACNSYTAPNGQQLISSGNYTYTLTDSQGCDSIIQLALNIIPSDTAVVNAQTCDSYIGPNGQLFNQSGTYFWNVPDVNGCDSITELHLSVLPPDTTVIQAQSCTPYVASNLQTYGQSGTYYWMQSNVFGCDSISELNLTINSGNTFVVDSFSCTPILGPNNQLLSQTGTYNYQFTDVNGCDSSIIFNFTRGTSFGSIQTSGCDMVSLNGVNYIASGNYQQTLTNAFGCDSILSVQVIVNSTSSSVLQASACNSYIDPFGQQITQSGTYNYTLTNSEGCDSLVTIDVSINATSSQLNISDCGSYTLNGVTYVSSGTYYQTLQNSLGCDSTIQLNLTLNQPNTGTLSATACTSYLAPDGNTYSQSGNYSLLLTNSVGCDSVVSLNLTINQPNQTSISASACTSYLAPDGSLLLQSGNYTYLLQNINGCDSIVDIALTILQPSQATLNVNTCNTFHVGPDGVTYTQSGTYAITTTNSAGCDSLITLNLNLLQNSSSTTFATACDNYLAPDGSVYTQSGLYTATIPNSVGCDSIITINLTVVSSNLITQQPTGQSAFINQNAQFTVQATSNVNFEWQSNVGFGFVPLSDAGQFSGVSTNQLQIQSLNMTNNNQVFRCILEQNGCYDTTNVVTLQVIDNTDLEEDDFSKITIFPNPTNRNLHFSEPVSGTCILTDARGRKVLSWQLDHETSISIRDVLPGTYILEWTFNGAVTRKRVIKTN